MAKMPIQPQIHMVNRVQRSQVSARRLLPLLPDNLNKKGERRRNEVMRLKLMTLGPVRIRRWEGRCREAANFNHLKHLLMADMQRSQNHSNRYTVVRRLHTELKLEQHQCPEHLPQDMVALHNTAVQ
jgi:hypothetical protein